MIVGMFMPSDLAKSSSCCDDCVLTLALPLPPDLDDLLFSLSSFACAIAEGGGLVTLKYGVNTIRRSSSVSLSHAAESMDSSLSRVIYLLDR